MKTGCDTSTLYGLKFQVPDVDHRWGRIHLSTVGTALHLYPIHRVGTQASVCTVRYLRETSNVEYLRYLGGT